MKNAGDKFSWTEAGGITIDPPPPGDLTAEIYRDFDFGDGASSAKAREKATMDHFLAPAEFKFAGDASTGEFEGYASLFSNMDSHGDVIQPGAFSETLAERKAQGRGPLPMHVMHGVFGGDGIPIGIWKSIAEDDRGLRVQGKVSGMNTDAGRLLFERVKDGALGGLSIGYKVKPNGAVYSQKAGEPRRTLKAVHLREISLVDDPSNPLARVDQVKARLDAGELPSLREFEEILREKGFSRSQAAQIAERGFKSLSRDEGDEQALSEAKDALKSALTGFKLPSFR